MKEWQELRGKEEESIQEEEAICLLYGQGTFYGEGMSGAQDLGRVQRYKSAWVSWGQASSDQTKKHELHPQA